MSHRPFLRSAIQVVGDFRIGDFDLQSVFWPEVKKNDHPKLRSLPGQASVILLLPLEDIGASPDSNTK